MCVTIKGQDQPVLLSDLLLLDNSDLNGDVYDCKNDEPFDFTCPTLEEHLSIIRSNEPTKKRSARRRAPQKPGLTAKGEIRHFVQHNYQDHSQDPDVMGDTGVLPSPLPLDSFPVKLFHMLNAVEESGRSDVVSWLPHGRAFLVHKPKTFVQQILPRYFSQSKLTSFQRQLNLYGFTRLTRGPDDGGYYHECFLRGKYFLLKKIARTKVKGTKYKATSSPESEPDFYSMPFVAVNPIVVTSPKAEYSDKQMGISMKRELTNAHSGIRSHLTAPNRMITTNLNSGLGLGDLTMQKSIPMVEQVSFVNKISMVENSSLNNRILSGYLDAGRCLSYEHESFVYNRSTGANEVLSTYCPPVPRSFSFLGYSRIISDMHQQSFSNEPFVTETCDPIGMHHFSDDAWVTLLEKCGQDDFIL